MTRSELHGSLASVVSDDDLEALVSDFRADELAVVAVKIEASDRIAAAFGRRVGRAVIGATLQALADTVSERGVVFVGAADRGGILVDTRHADPDEVVADVGRRLASTISVDGVDYFVETHVGVALPGDGLETTTRDMLQAALAALHGATRNNAQLVYAADVSIPDLRSEVELAAEIANAVGAEFTLHYQPIVLIDTGEVVGYESLLRWTVDDRLRLPGEFLDAAEETSLIVPIGRWGVGEAIRQLSVWHRESGRTDLFMSVNFSSQQLFDRGLAAHVASALADTGMPGSALWVEVTERDLIAADSPAAATIRELDAIGCVICVDDLGTGYAALRYMVDQPVRIAKLDRSLIEGIDEDGTKRSIVETVCRLAEKLQINTVAEGVENESQLGLLRSVGFTHAQGYLFGRPLPADEIDVSAGRSGSR